MYEQAHHELISVYAFCLRVLRSFAIASIVILISLGIGIVGYHATADLSWIDALLNASMILAGMGPTAIMPTDTAKVFSSIYALFSGIVFITSMSIVIAPMAHRLLHKFHLETETGESK